MDERFIIHPAALICFIIAEHKMDGAIISRTIILDDGRKIDVARSEGRLPLHA